MYGVLNLETRLLHNNPQTPCIDYDSNKDLRVRLDSAATGAIQF